MDIKIDLYFNKLTGEILGSREKRKFSKEVLMNKEYFQVLKVMRPFIFVKENSNGDLEAKAIEIEEFNYNILNQLKNDGYSISENHSPNSEVIRQYKTCQHCLSDISKSDKTNQINLEQYNDYIELKKNELIYFSNVLCNNCGEATKVTQYYKGKGFTNLVELDISEVVVDEIVYIEENEKIFKEQHITEILISKVYDYEKIPDISDIKNHGAIKSLVKYQDFKRIENVKFKKLSNFFKNKTIEKKYNVRKKFI